VAVSADGCRWFVVNASPDIRDQLRWLNTEPADVVRHVPIEGVLLTDAEVDHTLGVVLLREARLLPIYATAAVESVLNHDSRFLSITRAFSDVPLTELPIDVPVPLRYRDGSPSGIDVAAFRVAAGPPRFATTDADGHTVGLILRDDVRGKVCAFVPGCGDLDESTLARFQGVDALLFDGTFWSDDELISLGVGHRTARELDHVPINGPGGSLERLAALPCEHRIYTHVNNTNPILLEHSPERAAVNLAGITVGFDGLRLTL